MRTIFAHITGGTYRFETSRQQVSPSTIATVRKPVSVVSDATKAHEYNCEIEARHHSTAMRSFVWIVRNQYIGK